MSGQTPPRRKRPRTQPSGPSNRHAVSKRKPPSGRMSSDNLDKIAANGQPASNMRSFADLVGSGRSRAEQVLGDDAPDDAWATIANTLDNLGSASLPPPTRDVPDHSRMKPQDDIEGSAEMLGTLESAREIRLDGMIVDLTLKSRIQVASSTSLQWALRRSQQTEFEALQNVLRRGAGDEGGDEESAKKRSPRRRKRGGRDSEAERVVDAKKKMYEALIHFRYPSGPLPAKIAVDWIGLTANFGKTSWQSTPNNDPQKLCVNRLLQWQDALQSLFYGYRYGHIEEFYVILPTTVVIFTRGKPYKCAENDETVNPNSDDSTLPACPRACFARASPGLQALMGDYQVPFSVVEGTDGFEEPCVVVEGQLEIHLLYNFLCSVGHKISGATDVPTLLADKAFRGSTIAPAEVRNARKSIVTKKRDEPDEERHTLQIRGLFTPSQVRRICDALAIIQNNDIEMRFEADPKGSMLNMCGHGRKEGSGGDDKDKYKLRGPLLLSRIRVSTGVNGYAFATTDAH